jgi:hypothetical protein
VGDKVVQALACISFASASQMDACVLFEYLERVEISFGFYGFRSESFETFSLLSRNLLYLVSHVAGQAVTVESRVVMGCTMALIVATGKRVSGKLRKYKGHFSTQYVTGR